MLMSLMDPCTIILEKSVFCEYLTAASVSSYGYSLYTVSLATDFMLVSLIVIPQTISEISEFLGQLPVYDKIFQLNTSVGILHSKYSVFSYLFNICFLYQTLTTVQTHPQRMTFLKHSRCVIQNLG